MGKLVNAFGGLVAVAGLGAVGHSFNTLVNEALDSRPAAIGETSTDTLLGYDDTQVLAAGEFIGGVVLLATGAVVVAGSSRELDQ